MLDAAAKALSQMLSPPFRAVLLKSIALAVALLAVFAIALQRFIAWLAGGGEAWLEGALGPIAHMPLLIVFWLIAIVAALGLVVSIVFLMPAATALVAGLFGRDRRPGGAHLLSGRSARHRRADRTRDHRSGKNRAAQHP